MAAETLTPSPDWATLPALVVQQISGKLKSVTDFVRFRAVCPSWRSASLSDPRHLPPQIPWLMIPYNPNEDENPDDDSIRMFYDLYLSKMHKIHLPETRHMMCCATSKGWLLLMAKEGKRLELLNPLTRAKISLPNFTTPVNIFSHEPVTDDASTWFVGNKGKFLITKVVVSSDPTDPGCIITVFLRKVCRIFFCRVGDPCWTMVNLQPGELRPDKPSDGTFYNNKFYLADHEGNIRIYDLDNPQRKCLCDFDPDFQLRIKCLLEGKSGVYLGVLRGSKNNQDQQVGEDESSDEDVQGEENQQEDQEERSVDEDTSNRPRKMFYLVFGWRNQNNQDQQREEQESGDEDHQEAEEEKTSNDESNQEESSNDDDKDEKVLELYKLLDEVTMEESGGEDHQEVEEEKTSNDESNQEESSDDDDKDEKALELYKLLDEETMERVKNTRNTTIFIDDNSHCFLALDSDEWDSLKGDSLYMGLPCKPTVHLRENEFGLVSPCYGIFLASFEEGKGDDKIVGDLGVMPDLWPPPPLLWFQPSLV